MVIKGNAKIIPANPDGIFLPYQKRWITDASRLKLMEKAPPDRPLLEHGLCLRRTHRRRRRPPRPVGIQPRRSAGAPVHRRLQDVGEDHEHGRRGSRRAGHRPGKEPCRPTCCTSPTASASTACRATRTPRPASAAAASWTNSRLHPDPRKLWSIAYPGITWGGQHGSHLAPIAAAHNFFNQLVREIREHGNPKKISLHRVTLQDALDQGFLFKLQQIAAGRRTSARTWTRQPISTSSRSGCADEESFQQEYMCIPADDDVAFLEYDLIAGCEYAGGIDWQATAPGRPALFAGLDIGRKKDLTVLWVVEQLGDVLYTRHVDRPAEHAQAATRRRSSGRGSRAATAPASTTPASASAGPTTPRTASATTASRR